MRLSLALFNLASLLTAAASPHKREFRELSSDDMSRLAEHDPALEGFTDPYWAGGTLNSILIPRAPATDNNTLVQNVIKRVLTKLDWTIETDRFTASTPYGDREFTNIIATFDPHAPRRVVLSAHHDSKFFPSFPDNQFIGATDSAFPVSLMLSLATSLTPLLAARRERLQAAADSGAWLAAEDDAFDEEEAGATTVQLIFFDGEEAYKEWTDTDSTYGSRHLAETMQTTFLAPPPSTSYHSLSYPPYSPLATPLTSMNVLILLDLLGSPHPSISSYYPSTAWLYSALSTAESRLASAGLFASLGEDKWSKEKWTRDQAWFKGGAAWGAISDDHLPFLHRGVEILHVISAPFPSVWHTLRDDASALDIPTMRRWEILLRMFMAEYLGLRPLPDSSPSARDTKRDEEAVAEEEEERPRATATEASRRVQKSGGEL